jgi:glyoxylase-like metal-dependent hydrolase (beta-lactamase superfamily II)
LNGDNLTYLACHTGTREAIWVDPLTEDFDLTVRLSQELGDYRFVAVIDTHTHADHLSSAGELARALNAPLVMHRNAPSSKVDLRVSRDTHLSTAAGPLQLWVTPGHTWDGLTPTWGPFVFTGDTVFYADTGRDDLPTGNPTEHHESLQKLKAVIRPEQVVLPGHDPEGGRLSRWETQLRINPSLHQTLEEYLQDGGAWVGNPPKLLKESLFHNFK